MPEKTGRMETLSVSDALIAAMAKKRPLIAVARNVRDIGRCRAKNFNPQDDLRTDGQR